MVSDASSGDGRRADLERDKVPVKGADGVQPRSTADLTHELAQLLAATIAQRQLNNGLPATSPPPLNLAGLSVNQRILEPTLDRKSTRLNSSHLGISYAVFCLKKK